MDISYFLENVNCNSCKYRLLCTHITLNKQTLDVCYFWANQNENFPKKTGGIK